MKRLPDAEAQRLFRRIERMARVMDNSIRVPFIGKRIGWDAVLGLVPGAGDVVGALISGYIVLAGWRLGVPAGGLVKMLGNIGFDTLGGAVPVLGDVFDMAFKSNARNVALVEKYLQNEPESAGASASGAAVC